MVRLVLSDTKWERIKDFLPRKACDCGVTVKEGFGDLNISSLRVHPSLKNASLGHG